MVRLSSSLFKTEISQSIVRSTVAKNSDEEGGQSPLTAVRHTIARKGLKKPPAPKKKRKARKRRNW